MKYSPRESAVVMSMHPPTADEKWDLLAQLMASQVDLQAVTNYLLQRLGGNDRATYPDPIPRPGVESKAETSKFVGKPVTMAEMDVLLGWNQDKK